MKGFLLDMLVDPVDKSPLIYNESEQELYNHSGIAYPVNNNIPVLLPKDTAPAVDNTSSLHEQFKSHFNYSDHYQKDTVLFDYFKEDESAVARFERNISRKAIISRVPKGDIVLLDAGCGGGWVAKRFAGSGIKLVSMDISTSNPEKVLKDNPADGHAGLTADAMFLPLKKDSVDCIIAAEIIEHVPDPARLVQNFTDALKPGGRLILITPYNEKIRYHLCVHCNLPTPESAHLHSFNEKNIVKLLPETGYSMKTWAFVNKYILKLRIYNLLSFLPFGLWKAMDSFVNKLNKNPRVFLIEINKNKA